ncbi:ADP-ribosylation factor-like protein 8 [Nematocida sp. AWRm80]|nr:ADP-ribosylation factor-like protein 8 [Nematocida sp. AWRm80]
MNIKECIERTKNCFTYYFFGRKIKICMGGVSGSGKTSFCKAFTKKYVLKKERSTQGMRMHKFIKEGVHGTFYDIGGGREYENLLDFNYKNSNVLFFVVDASSPETFPSAREMLESLLYRNKGKKSPILILCTHNDVDGAVLCQDLALELGIDSLLGRDISCYSISSLTLSNFTAVEEWIQKRAK